MNRIGILSDTHGLLREEVKENLRGCGAVLHGGDIHRQDILAELGKIAPVYAVRGNADTGWAEAPPALLAVELFGIRIKMAHNKKDLLRDAAETLRDTDLAVYGHSHKYADELQDGVRWLNPGSCGPRRFRLPITMAVLEADGGKIKTIRRIEIKIPGGPAGEALKMPEGEQDRRKLVQAVMRDVDRGRTVEKIAQGNHISHQLAEQICRMYLTHPGVDVDGILDRISR